MTGVTQGLIARGIYERPLNNLIPRSPTYVGVNDRINMVSVDVLRTLELSGPSLQLSHDSSRDLLVASGTQVPASSDTSLFDAVMFRSPLLQPLPDQALDEGIEPALSP